MKWGSSMFKNKNILISGGCGSIGTFLIHELLKQEPKVIRLYDIDEDGLWRSRKKFGNYANIRFLKGDVCNRDRLDFAMENINIVYHLAAMKHVHICEYNPFEALETNVLGTNNIIHSAIDNDVEKVIFTSSDKAVNPTTVMGTTKLLAEKLIIAANYYSVKTILSCVRLGNLLGSRGTVLNLFEEQIKNGVPLTITDENMTRFIMTPKEMVEFLFNVTNIMQSGEIFVPKMKALKIIDLANAIAEKNHNSYEKASRLKKIEFTTIGRQTGEKLYEELMTSNEALNMLETDSMFIILPEISEFNREVNKTSYKITLDKSLYPEAKIFQGDIYNSKSEEYLTVEEIKELLEKINSWKL